MKTIFCLILEHDKMKMLTFLFIVLIFISAKSSRPENKVLDFNLEFLELSGPGKLGSMLNPEMT